MKRKLLTLSILAFASQVFAQGEISQELLNTLRSNSKLNPAERALRNGLATSDIRTFALNQENQTEQNTYFNYSVPSKGITDQKSSGRCWLFTGLNVLRSQLINQKNLEVGVLFRLIVPIEGKGANIGSCQTISQCAFSGIQFAIRTQGIK